MPSVIRPQLAQTGIHSTGIPLYKAIVAEQVKLCTHGSWLPICIERGAWGQVAVVRDEVADISAEVRAAAPNHEVVLTAGGIGPTCDDVTMAGIADALGKPLERYIQTFCCIIPSVCSLGRIKIVFQMQEGLTGRSYNGLVQAQGFVQPTHPV